MDPIFFYEWFPELSETETLTISLTKEDAAGYGLPAAQYFCIEVICPNPDCDCHEVVVTVVGDHFSGPLAHLRVELGDERKARVNLDAEMSQSQYAEKLVRLLNDRLSREPLLAAQLQRHYGLVKKRSARESARRQFFAPR